MNVAHFRAIHWISATGYILAQVYEKWGRVEEAVGVYRSALALDPDNAVAGDRLQTLLQGRASEK